MKLKVNLLGKSSLAKNTAWSLIGFGSRIVVQAGYFILLARLLGTEGFGAFVGVAAIVAILFSFSGLGIGGLMVKNVARNPEAFNVYWGNGIMITIITSLLLVPLATSVGVMILPKGIPILFILFIAVSDIVFIKLTEIAGQAFQAIQKLNWTAFINIQISLMKMLAVCILWLGHYSYDIMSWGYAYLISSIISAVIAAYLVTSKLGKPRLELARIGSELKEGLYFSIGTASVGLQNDSDKSIMTSISSLESVGIYGAANRIIDVAFTPVRSLLYAAYAKFFQHGEKGLRGSLNYSIKLLPLGVTYGILCGAALYLFAPIMPVILGPGFEGSVDAVRWLACIPLLKSIHYFAADSLTGAGFQGFRSLAQIVVAIFSVIFNLLMIPILGWKGAALTAICSNGLLAILLWLGSMYLINKEKKYQRPMETTKYS